jgi:hypothetical protein
VSPVERALLRFLGLWAVLAGVDMLERVAYRAGALDTARAIVDEDLADDLAPAVDLADVAAAHRCAGASCCEAAA